MTATRSWCSPALTDADDRRHQLADTALARESLIFILILPEEDLGAIAYTWVDGAGRAGSMGLVFGADNSQLARFHVEGVEVPASADFDDWQVGPLSVRHGAPHQVVDVAFTHGDASLEYHFEAMTPAFSYHDNREGCPPFLADNRLEQSGRVRGTLRLGDRVVPFETTGHRDHSWGMRDWTAFHHYKWINIQAEPDIAINLMHGLAIDQLWQLGYVDRDGVQSPITTIDADLERDVSTFSYTGLHLRLVDELGRTTEVEADHRNPVVVWPAGGMESHDAGGPCSVDGRPGLMHVEEGWQPEFVVRRKAMMTQEFDSDEALRVLATNRDVGTVDNS